MKKIELDDLWRRVHEYRTLNPLEDKHQVDPLHMHMRAYYLINDLWKAIDKLDDEIKAIQGADEQEKTDEMTQLKHIEGAIRDALKPRQIDVTDAEVMMIRDHLTLNLFPDLVDKENFDSIIFSMYSMLKTAEGIYKEVTETLLGVEDTYFGAKGKAK